MEHENYRKDSFDIVKKFELTFESYWNNQEFKKFNFEEEKASCISKRH